MSRLVEQVPPGKAVKGALVVGQRAGGEEISIIYHILRGLNPGPTVWFNGAIHGDELNGPIALLQLSQKLQPEQISGTIILTPVSNPLAFAARQKNTPHDLLDLDQQFPGDPEGTLSQRIAYQLFHVFGTAADYIVDSHTVGHDYFGQPYTVTKKIRQDLQPAFEQAQKLAEIFGGAFHCSLDFSENLNEVPGNVYGFLDVQAQLQGKVAFMVELGAGGIHQPDAVRFALEGYQRLLVDLKLLSSKKNPPASKLPAISIKKRYYLYANTAGFLTFSVQAGDFVKKGTLLAEVTDLYGQKTAYRAMHDAFVLINRNNAVVETGDRLFFLGESWNDANGGKK
ncbi:succinylglutamate desuccinylase/aspartoacylase family protein [Enterococcus sp. OL5]|uniref:succinylglutamate desuccinylase/aspartoacylase domain-containing protein n=1 Tax=Enterococcus sp. OL5 TaxID=2590214 RepID=UPI00112D4C8E|nr:succinylglutamate desuccinylase/aspartoacylase family protein [Enterococcus sp. OL5]TPR55122.1 hypothetical protein FJU10_18585 [Enterococcus sp. OL5]